MNDPLYEESINDILDEQYMDFENKSELDYWEPISQLINESILLRDKKSMTQTDLAKKMKTKQSVISRFENMGRLPNYDLIARLAIALDHAPGMTLHGDYMAVASMEQQEKIKELAQKEKITTKKYVQDVFDKAIESECETLNK